MTVSSRHGRRAGLLTILAIVILAACGGEQAASPQPPATTAATSGSKCAWPVKANKDVMNIAYPDTSATYWAISYSLAPGERLALTGSFPDARYMSFITYAASGGALAVLADRDIAPDQGSSNPFRGEPKRDADHQRYTVEVRGDPTVGPNQITAASIPSGSTVSNTTAPDAPGTTVNAATRDAALGTGGSTGTIGTIIYRVYVPASDSDPSGGTGLPTVAVIAPDGTKAAAPLCPNPGPSPNAGALVSTYGPATDTPAPATPVFIRPARGNNLFPNPDNVYVATIAKHEAGQVIVVRGTAPTFPDTRAGKPITGHEQVRFWSLCTNEYRKPYPVSFCKRDDETALDADGRFTFVISTPEDRPANATAENHVTWIDEGDTSVNILLLFRHMLADKSFTESAINLAPGALATSSMGPYAPRGAYCSKATFEAGGASGCGL